MENFTPISAFIGGIIIGIASLFLLFSTGKIAGISGILERSIFTWQRLENRYWALWFIVGLIIGGEIVQLIGYPGFGSGHPHNIYLIGIGGLLVGFGSRLGSGCTSGHGVCGLGRLSFRSFVAVITFMSSAFLTLLIKRLIS
ncbi:MAG: YeeE/YedE family protein [Leptospira sp.]|nr:YeeE/YedE family protein [Leptospira sp.]